MSYEQVEVAVREREQSIFLGGRNLVNGNLMIQMFQLTIIPCKNAKVCAKIPNFLKQ